jgi:AraC-like DNA-binding protein
VALLRSLYMPAAPAGPPPTLGDERLECVLAYIAAHLADPRLRPATIAAAHFLSVRALHKLFERHHLTVAAHIRRLRLQRCRERLADPADRGRAVSLIAAEWGFRDASTFSRQFRREFGVSPRELRLRP